MKIQKKKYFFFGGGGVRFEGGVGLGVRVDENEELKFLGEIHKKKIRGGGLVEEVVRLGVRLVGGSGWM